MATSKRLLRRGGLVLVGAFALAQPAWALFGNAELTRQTQALQQRADAVDARLGKIEAALQDNRKLLDLLKEVETLKAENARLRGLAEMQQHQLETLGKRQNDLYADLDQRLADLAKAAQPANAGVAATGAPPADASAASRSYEAALALFREANYPGAIAGFGNFLKTHPDSELAANAQYWI
ncbi:MAG: YbgF trimerization domain-containing protein, partial [Thiobacillus sp.]|nr:YbgF trimerization domain-containing protein [Thiobacillus sp.]